MSITANVSEPAEPQAAVSEPVALEPVAPPARTDIAAEFAMIVAGLSRLAAQARDDRTALDRLRDELSEMAQAIAMAKSIAEAVPTATLLDEFGYRIDAMLEIATGERPAPARQPVSPTHADTEAHDEAPAITEWPEPAEPVAATEAEQVPTVSDVISNVGQTHDAGEIEPARDIAAAPASGAAQGPTVAMLTAMVQALSEGIVDQATRPQTADPEAAERQPREWQEIEWPVAQIQSVPLEAPATEAMVAEPTAIVEPETAEAAVGMAVAPIVDATEDTILPDAPIAETELAETPEALSVKTYAHEMEAVAAPAAEFETTEIAADSFSALVLEAPEDAVLPDTPVARTEVTETQIPTLSVEAEAHELALLANLERMGTRPLPPPDEGTAVIFTALSASETPFVETPLAGMGAVDNEASLADAEGWASPESESRPQVPSVAELEPPVLAQHHEPAQIEVAPIVQLFEIAAEPEPTPATENTTAHADVVDLQAEATAIDPDALEFAESDLPLSAVLEPATAPASARPGSDAEEETEFDPEAFLFGPVPEDPAAFLLEPASPPVATSAADKAASITAQTPSETAAHDPLHALKAMSEEEKIALFT